VALNSHTNQNNPFDRVSSNNNNRKFKGYTKGEFFFIILTILITLMGFLVRTWRILREGNPITFDGYFYFRYLKRDFFQGGVDFSNITRDPPGFTFIIIMATHLLGLKAEPMMWVIYVFPQILCSIQLIIFFVLARRLTQSRMIGLLSMFFMSFLGVIVYRNQNIAPETFVLGLVPYVVFYLLRYLETKDHRYLALGLMITLGITMIHHLTTAIVLAIWHILLIYEIIYCYNKNKKFTRKDFFVNFITLTILDVFVILFWQFVLKGFPLNFINSSITNLFIEGESKAPVIIMIVVVVIINVISFSLFYYNFNRKKINQAIIASSIIGILAIFIIAMFFGASSPDQSLKSALLMGTNAFVLAPLGAIGLIFLEKRNFTRSRMLRGWLFSIIFIISVIAIFPNMSSFLGRLALYIAGIGVILAAIAVFGILKKINIRKYKAILLVCLIGSIAATLSYSHPKPENNWNTQEIYWDAEFKTVDFLIVYSYTPNNTVWEPTYSDVVVDCDFRFSAIVEGISGIQTTFEYGRSWLMNVLFTNETYLSEYLNNSSPLLVNSKIKYILINDVMKKDGFMTGWAAYGEDNIDWIKKLPDMSSNLPFNPHISRIYDTKITILFVPK